MIETINLYRLRTGEFVQFTSDVANLLQNSDTAALKIQEKTNVLIARNIDLNEAYNKIRRSGLTRELHEIDQRRDNYFRGLLTMADAYTLFSGTPEALAAQRVLDIIESFGRNIHRKGYTHQSADTSNLIARIEGSPEAMADLVLLHMDGWFGLLKAENSLFIERFRLRDEQQASVNDQSFRDARNLCYEAYQQLCRYLDALVLIDGEASYAELLSKLNAIISRYNQIIAVHSSSGETEEPLTE
ncbi:MAG: DUF6261 family protein [Salinivirgaceae bacterium]